MLPTEVLALLGKFDLKVEGEYGAQRSNVQEIIIHPDWDVSSESYDADISIVVLSTPIQFSSFIQPICLPKYDHGEISGTGIITGWGSSENSTRYRPDSTPSKLEIPAVNGFYCLLTIPKLAYIASLRTFCGGYKNESKAPCLGDSGGGYYTKDKATMTSWNIKGIISSGLQDHEYGCDINKFSLYTNVPIFSKWIMRVMMETNWK